ncbi:uncharacterized protein METZ01_LOCUS479789, partial [marine metagenome]
MLWTGINGTDLLDRAFKLSFCLAAVGLMVFSSGCTSSAGIRRSRLVKPEAPDTVVAVAEAVAEAADDRAEVVAGEIEQPIEAKTVSDTTGSEVAKILQQTRGAVFASLSTPVGAGPPASAVKLDEAAENAADSGVQDSVSSQTGGDATGTTVDEAPEAPAPTEDESQESAVTEEVAEENVAEAVPEPEPAKETPAQEEVETAEAEVARVESPPESVAT